MKKQQLLSAISVGLISMGMISTADAALLSRLRGLAYYDDAAKLTWLADVDYAYTSGDDADGIMSWDQANAWVRGLTVAGVSGWRLPTTLQPDASCRQQSGSTISYGYDCAGGELGNMYYNVLGNSAYGGGSSYGPFVSKYSNALWTGTEYRYDPSNSAWYFNANSGYQSYDIKNRYNRVWAVKSGDVSAVPVPAAAWLFGSGLLGLIGLARRKG